MTFDKFGINRCYSFINHYLIRGCKWFWNFKVIYLIITYEHQKWELWGIFVHYVDCRFEKKINSFYLTHIKELFNLFCIIVLFSSYLLILYLTKTVKMHLSTKNLLSIEIHKTRSVCLYINSTAIIDFLILT